MTEHPLNLFTWQVDGRAHLMTVFAFSHKELPNRAISVLWPWKNAFPRREMKVIYDENNSDEHDVQLNI